ncbi:MAG: DUF4290 domain-containing protein [Bacteroidales bacterium]|nr:DUF4290 domain-containing protein [Bacteroidales bacterium]
MDTNEIDTCKLLYNTERVKLYIPEYGRNVQKMVDYLKTIEDRQKRNEQARAIVKVMEIINPAVHLQDNYEQKLWDHLHIISGFDLDVDSPYPAPAPESLHEKPMSVPAVRRPVKVAHYGRNIENFIDLIAGMEDGEQKTAMIRTLGTYMRQQYLIWNKDSVSDATILQDIERLSDFKIKVPEGLQLSRLDAGATYTRPGAQQQQKQGKRQKGNQKNRKQYK